MTGTIRRDAGADVVVVGGGTAGCVVASRLAAESDREIVVLEAGPLRAAEESRVPGDAFYALNDRITYDDVTVPQPGLDGRAVSLRTGRGLGGGSSVNLLAWFQGHPVDFDGWLAAGPTTTSALTTRSSAAASRAPCTPGKDPHPRIASRSAAPVPR